MEGARRTIVWRELPVVKGKGNPRMEEVNQGKSKGNLLGGGINGRPDGGISTMEQ